MRMATTSCLSFLLLSDLSETLREWENGVGLQAVLWAALKMAVQSILPCSHTHECVRSSTAWPCIWTVPGSRLPGFGGLFSISDSEPPGYSPVPEAWPLYGTGQPVICALAALPPQVLKSCWFVCKFAFRSMWVLLRRSALTMWCCLAHRRTCVSPGLPLWRWACSKSHVFLQHFVSYFHCKAPDLNFPQCKE